MSLQFPRTSLFVPSHWHILAEVIMSQITVLNYVKEKRLSRPLDGMIATWKLSFSSSSVTVQFFLGNEIWKYSAETNQALLSTIPEVVDRAPSSCSTVISSTSAECPAWLSVKDNTHPSELLPFLPEPHCAFQTSVLLQVAWPFSTFYFLALLPSQLRFGTSRRMFTRT